MNVISTDTGVVYIRTKRDCHCHRCFCYCDKIVFFLISFFLLREGTITNAQ